MTKLHLGLWIACTVALGCDQASPDEPPSEGNPSVDGGPGMAEPDATADAAMSSDERCDGEGIWDGIPVREQHFPMVDGARWVYRHLGATEWDEEITMETTSFEGRDAMRVLDTPGPSGNVNENVFVSGASAVCRVQQDTFRGERMQARTFYRPGFTRFDRRWLEWSVDQSETVTYRRTEFDPQGIMVRDADRTHVFQLQASNETVQVAAGEFRGCLRIYRDRIRDAADAETADEDKLFWFCPGVGKVREADPDGTTTEELLECEVPFGLCG